MRSSWLETFLLLVAVSTSTTILTTVSAATKVLLDAGEQQPDTDWMASSSENVSMVRRRLSSFQPQEPLDTCVEAMENSSLGSGLLSQDAYVAFLEEISGGDVSYQEFRDLPFFFITLFFTAACSDGQDCVKRDPAIVLGQDSSRHHVAFVCRHVLRWTFASVDLNFDYNVKFNPSTDSGGNIRQCLESAANSVLLDGLSPICQQENSSSSINGPSCFSVKVEVSDLYDLDCANTSNTRCALVRSHAEVSTSQLYVSQQRTGRLRTKVVNILKRSINGGLMEQHLPRECIA